jgi:hypothetical protein
MNAGDTALKYGHDVRGTIAAISKGNAEALGHREFVMTKLYQGA